MPIWEAEGMRIGIIGFGAIGHTLLSDISVDKRDLAAEAA